jgi:hypothetical protein
MPGVSTRARRLREILASTIRTGQPAEVRTISAAGTREEKRHRVGRR